jgi:hypothetical protein
MKILSLFLYSFSSFQKNRTGKIVMERKVYNIHEFLSFLLTFLVVEEKKKLFSQHKIFDKNLA